MSVTDSYQSLIDRAKAGYPKSWIPEKKDDALAGKFVRVEMGNTAYGPTPIAVIADDNGELRSVWLFHEALRSQMMQANPQPGDAIAIVYLGEVKAKNPTPGRSPKYHAYRVVKDATEDSAPIDWGAITGAGSTAPVEDIPSDEFPFE